MRKNTTDIVRYACKAFQKWSGVTAPEEVTRDLLQEFYDLHSGYRVYKPSRQTPTGSEIETSQKYRKPLFVNVATAQGYVSKIATFLRRQGNSLKVDLRRLNPEARDVVVPSDVINKLINECPRKDLKFVLLAGFHAGLRKEEIIMARPEWFKLNLGRISVPKIQVVEDRIWEVKSSRPRKVPLTPDFRRYLTDELQGWEQQTYMLHPERGGQRYRWDFNRPFVDYMEAHDLWKMGGQDNVTAHSMRHTYITHLADMGYSAAQMSAWSGDRIRTLETNYLHTSAPEGAVNKLYSPSQPVSLDTVMNAVQDLKDQLGEDSAKLIQSMLREAMQQAPQTQVAPWEWTDIVPEAHRRLYTPESTVNDHETFQSIFDPDDGRISHFDWAEGRLSTIRARFMTLEELGWIRPRPISNFDN